MKILAIKIYHFLFFLVRPHYWLMIKEYCPNWDAELKRLISEHEFVRIDHYTAKLGDRCIWIENRPYATMTPYIWKKVNYRASRMTTYRAIKKLPKKPFGFQGWDK